MYVRLTNFLKFIYQQSYISPILIWV